jgi:hypothetical protein
VTLTSVIQTATEIDLIFKSQGTSTSSPMVEIWYRPQLGVVEIWTYDATNGWVIRGTSIPVTFVAGDTIGARAYANGGVEVYRNGNLIGAGNVSAWQYYSLGGKIGIWTIGSKNGLMDNFFGGTFTP